MKKDLADIFTGRSQHVDAAPAEIRCIGDRVLIRDLGDEEKVGSIVIPEEYREKAGGAGKNGLLRFGIVVGVGPGDKVFEMTAGGRGAEFGFIERKLITGPCPHCRQGGKEGYKVAPEPNSDGVMNPCPVCEGTRRVGVVVPPQCQPGDKVIYDRMRHEEVYLGGVRHSLVHAEQAVIAVVED